MDYRPTKFACLFRPIYATIAPGKSHRVFYAPEVFLLMLEVRQLEKVVENHSVLSIDQLEVNTGESRGRDWPHP